VESQTLNTYSNYVEVVTKPDEITMLRILTHRLVPVLRESKPCATQPSFPRPRFCRDFV